MPNSPPSPANRALPKLEEVRAEKAKRSLAEFVRQFWPLLEPTNPLAWNWHLDAVCQHLEAVSRGQLTRLVISIPPGHMKSLLVSVFWPAWHWAAVNPSWRTLFASYAQSFATRDSTKCRTVIESDAYRMHMRGWTMKEDQNRKDYYENTLGGVRLSTSVTGQVVGHRGDCVVVDDPINTMDAFSEIERARVLEWWDLAMSSRLNDMRTGARVIIMQRLHENDLTGHVLKQGGYEHLCLPSEFEPEQAASTSIGWRDPRKERGELLFPERFPREVIEKAKEELGSYGFAAQHQQRPSSREGGMFKKSWFKFYGTLPPKIDEWIATVDCTFKNADTSDYVVAQVWARAGANKYLVHSYRARLDMPGTCAMLRRLKAAFPQVGAILVEDKANGPAVIQSLKDEIPGLMGWSPGSRSKEERAAAIVPTVEAGQVYLPGFVTTWEGPRGNPVEAFLHECAAFPKGANDDQVDAMTMALSRWRRGDALRIMPIPTRTISQGVDH